MSGAPSDPAGTVPGGADCPESAAGDSSAALDRMWRSQLVWWHALFAALLALVTVLAVAAGGPTMWLQLACMAGIAELAATAVGETQRRDNMAEGVRAAVAKAASLRAA